MTEDGTESGTLFHDTMATDGLEATIMTWVAGRDETHEAGTATGDHHEVGAVTV
jgi:hypothetical protein